MPKHQNDIPVRLSYRKSNAAVNVIAFQTQFFSTILAKSLLFLKYYYCVHLF